MTCPHRGSFLRQVRSDVCGSRGAMVNVFACDLFKECTERKWKHKQPEAICNDCDHWPARDKDDGHS